MNSKENYNLLVVDDDPQIVESVRTIFNEDANITVEGVLLAKEALELIRKSPRKYAVVLMDYLMPLMNGADATKEILKINPDLIVAMNSVDDTRETLKSSFTSGAVDFIEKRMTASEFKRKIYSFCRKYDESVRALGDDNTNSKNKEQIESLSMIGQSDALAEVTSLVRRAANSNSPVLITGESGTGKELIAKAIHKFSKRAGYGFVTINSGAISPELFESELFGHMKGSFTGALHDKIGHFKSANGGVLFLDEIGDLKLEHQVKLLRALQEGEIRPVGSTKVEKVNVRIVAATNIDLEEAISNGKFRQDLFYRLNVLEIKMPPLRERIEDIRPLTNHFKKKYYGSDKIIMMDVIKKFERYSWPGNIRELEAEIERLMALVPENKIELRHLSTKFFDPHMTNYENDILLSYEEFKTLQIQREISYFKKIIKKYGNVREAAAEGFKVPRSTLFSRIKALGINL